MLPQKICFVDIETTGASVTYDRIIEIGIVKVENNKVTDTYETLINPGVHISPFIEELTGIGHIDLENAPTFYEVKEGIREFLGDSYFVAHNVRFDYGFLRNEFKRHDVDFRARHFCTVILSRIFYPESKRHNLDSVIERFKLECKNRHRALSDAKVLSDFYSILLKLYGEENLANAIMQALKHPSIPNEMLQEQVELLPESPGVYIFRGENNFPLYVGKSTNVKNRVYQHFSSDHTSSKQMHLNSQIQGVEVIPTAGELSALFRESSLVKSIQPFYNRQLRHARRIIVAKRQTSENGYFSINLFEKEKIELNELESITGVFRSFKQAKIRLSDVSKKYQLCEKYLGIADFKKTCFHYQLGWCKGACDNKEKNISYNSRFIMAFSDSRIRDWPFAGPIAIYEKNIDFGISEIILVDKWCYIGSYREEDGFKQFSDTILFDLDIYKILKRYILSYGKQMNIKNLSDDELQSITEGRNVETLTSSFM